MTAASPLRIALVQTQAESAGAQEISRLVSQGLEARGHDVHQIFFFRRTASFDDVPNALACCLERPSGPLAVAGLVLRLRAVLKRLKPDVVVTFQHFGNLIAAPVARSLGIRRIVANQSTAASALPSAIRTADLILGTAGGYDRVVVNSAETAQDYARHPRRYRERVLRIDHGFEDKTVATTKTEARKAFGLPAGVPLIGCAARLHPGKQLDLAIRTLPINEDFHLALAGQGPAEDALDTLATSLGVRERLHLLGELRSEQVGLFLAALDGFVFPSAAESFGLAPVEAAQAGVPVVANALPVLREVLAVEGEPCALFVDVTDTAAFATAIRRLVEDESLAGILRSRGRRLKDRFPLDGMVQGYVNLIESLV